MTLAKKDFPVSNVRRHLETGPIVLVSSAWKGRTNIMTMGWHMVMQFSPSLFGCYIWEGNHSFEMVRKSKECVINVPTMDLIDTVVDIGNCSGANVDKFEKFSLTAVKASRVSAPLIGECYASFECKLEKFITPYGLFVWEVVKAHVAERPKRPKTIHYRGDGDFMVAGPQISRRRRFRPGML